MLTIFYKGLALPALYHLIEHWGLPHERSKMMFTVHIGTTIGGGKAYFTGTNVLRAFGEYYTNTSTLCYIFLSQNIQIKFFCMLTLAR